MTPSHSSSDMFTRNRSRRMPGVVDEHVEPAVALDRGPDQPAGAGEVGDVLAVGDRLAAARLDLVDDLLRRRRIGAEPVPVAAEVVDDDLGALGARTAARAHARSRARRR